MLMQTRRLRSFSGGRVALALCLCSTFLLAPEATADEQCAQGVAIGESRLSPQRIYGTVTRLEPLCVNGFAIEMPSQTRFMKDGRPSSREALGLGHIVRIETNASVPLVAKRIDMDVVLGGPIRKIDVAARTLKIMAAEVRIREDALILGTDGEHKQLHQLLPGMHLEVSGLWTDENDVRASRLEVRPAGSPHHITGLARPIGSQGIYVQMVRGGTKNPMGFDRELRHQRVQLRGTWNERRQQLDEAFTRVRPIVSPSTRTVSLEGIAKQDLESNRLGFGGDQPRWYSNETRQDVDLTTGSRALVLAVRDDSDEVGKGEQWTGKTFTLLQRSSTGSEFRVAPASKREVEAPKEESP